MDSILLCYESSRAWNAWKCKRVASVNEGDELVKNMGLRPHTPTTIVPVPFGNWMPDAYSEWYAKKLLAPRVDLEK